MTAVLDVDRVPTPRGGKKWSHTIIRSILVSEKYRGDALWLRLRDGDLTSHKRAQDPDLAV
ncbi:MAG: hypothetical protein DI580_11575 [Cutibacterium acnes]|nr:MAG: hypothetical protein DI580_11575 [Cutibacterium acnes]